VAAGDGDTIPGTQASEMVYRAAVEFIDAGHHSFTVAFVHGRDGLRLDLVEAPGDGSGRVVGVVCVTPGRRLFVTDLLRSVG